MDYYIRIEKSRTLARLLRHDKSYTFKKEGFRAVSNVLEKLHISFEELEEIVAKDSKGRYAFNQDKTEIRAVDGHDKFIPLSPKTPAADYPDILFHGTTYKAVKPILEQGIKRMGDRALVHLSADRSTALSVGARHKTPNPQPVVLCINTTAMKASGVSIYPPEAAAWLADYVSPDYIEPQMLIGYRVSYYENVEQAKTILSICNDSGTHQQIINVFAQEKDSMIRFINYIDDAASIAQAISFENNEASKTIIAFIPISTSIDEHEYETIYNHLACYIEELREVFLTGPLIQCMPNTEIEDKSRALFYLTSIRIYQSSTTVIFPLDWFDIKKLWEKSSSFFFSPIIVADTITTLLEHISNNIEPFISKNNVGCVVYLDVPTEAAGNYLEIMDFAWDMRQDGIVLLLGVNAINGQKFLANITIMEGA